MRLVGVLTAMVVPLLLVGCITVSPPTITSVPAPQAVPTKGPQERLKQAATAVDDTSKICSERIDQHQITTAIGFVRCRGESIRQAYQQSDLLVMDLVEKRLDVLYKAAVMLDNDQLTVEQFRKVDENLRDWFFEEINKRFAGQLSAPTPDPSSSAATTRYK
jgi:hypothetical protein